MSLFPLYPDGYMVFTAMVPGSIHHCLALVLIFLFYPGSKSSSRVKVLLKDWSLITLNVALSLGTMIHSFDFDDYPKAKLHPGAVVGPAAWTMAEREPKTGKEFLTSLITRYEVMIRVSLATGPAVPRQKGWHLTGTCGTFGATAAAGKILGLREEDTVSAFALAGTQSASLWAFTADGSKSKCFHPGRSAQSGIMAALLAQKGYRGPTKILEAKDGGFCQAMSETSNLELLTAGLGQKFEAEEITFKPYSCCGSLHSTIYAIRELKRIF